MINIQEKSTELLELLKQDNLTKDDERPVSPSWLRKHFPKDYPSLEMNLHIMTWHDFLSRLCHEIKNEIDEKAINYDYIDRDAYEIRLADHIHSHLPKGYQDCYFDISAPIDEYSSFITYDIISERAQEYQGPKEVEWYQEK